MGELKLCEHGNLYHCNICEIKYLKNVIDEYKKENEIIKFKMENDFKNLCNEVLYNIDNVDNALKLKSQNLSYYQTRIKRVQELLRDFLND